MWNVHRYRGDGKSFFTIFVRVTQAMIPDGLYTWLEENLDKLGHDRLKHPFESGKEGRTCKFIARTGLHC